MLRTEASFSSLKDGCVFRASLELHFLKETHTKKCTKTTNFFLRRKETSIEKRKRGKWRKSYSCTVRERLFVCSAAEEPRRILPLLRLYNGALWEELLFRSALDGNASPPFLIRAKQLGLPFRVVNRCFRFCFPVSQMLKQQSEIPVRVLRQSGVRPLPPHKCAFILSSPHAVNVYAGFMK